MFGLISDASLHYNHPVSSIPQSTENGTGEVENPCLLNGTRLTYNDSEICSSACVTSDTSSEVFGYGYDCPFPSSEAENHTFIGTGEPDKCNKTIHKLFDLTQCSDPTVCINNTYFWPPVNKSGHYLVSPNLTHNLCISHSNSHVTSHVTVANGSIPYTLHYPSTKENHCTTVHIRLSLLPILLI